MGVDEARPELAWVLGSQDADQAQSAYRVRVASSADVAAHGGADVWDSGKVESPISTGIPYSGPALSSGTRYFWTVQLWDSRGRVSSRSDVFGWEMGLLRVEDWHHAKWLTGRQSSLTSMHGAHWLWFPDGDPGSFFPEGKAFFRGTFDVQGVDGLISADLAVAADDVYAAYVNGVKVANPPAVPNGWQSAQSKNVLGLLRDGENTIAVEVTNTGTTPAGMLAKLLMTSRDGAETAVTSDSSWRSSKEGGDEWTSPTYEDSAWQPALDQGAYGGGIWGDRVSVKSDTSVSDLRGEFTTDREVVRARAYVTGVGYYELSIDGARVGDRVLEPGFTLYDDRVLYSTYDVTEAVRTPGDHALGIALGRGFYGLDPNDTAYYWRDAAWLGEPRAMLALNLEYADGSTETVVSDESWRSNPSPTVRDSIYLGETYDARLAVVGWDEPGFAADGWRRARVVDGPTSNLRSQMMDPIRVVGSMTASEITNPKPGTYVFSFPAMTAGWARLTVEGPAGTEVVLRYGETLRGDGTVNNDGDPGLTNGPVQTDRYILSGRGKEVWEPRFSYKGFQYIQVDGYPGTPTPADVSAQVVHTDVRSTGTFESSSDLLTGVHAITRRTIQNNMHSVLTDSPMFEKRAWLGDANVLLPTTMSNFDMQTFYQNWLYALRANQGEDGSGVEVTPGPEKPRYWDPVWSGALVSMPWELYEYYGDVRTLERSYGSMKRYVDYLATQAVDHIQPGHYGDWVAPVESGTWPWGPEGPRLTGTAYSYRYALEVADAAAALGRENDEDRYRAEAQRIKDAFNAEFLDREKGVYRTERNVGYRQTSNAIPLTFGLVPEDFRTRVAANLAADVESRGFHLNTGHAGTKELLAALADNGYVDTAYRVATQTSYPSWGYWLSMGATTLWEAWHDGTRSRDHPFLGTVDDWFYRGLAGIKPRAPGFAQIAIVPQLPEALDHAAASVQTKRGRVSSSWTRTDDGYRLEVTVPVNATAAVSLPVDACQVVLGSENATSRSHGNGSSQGRQTFDVGSGSRTFTVRARRGCRS